MGSAEDESLGGNEFGICKVRLNHITTWGFFFVTTFQVNTGNGYPVVRSAAQVFITRP